MTGKTHIGLYLDLSVSLPSLTSGAAPETFHTISRIDPLSTDERR